MTPLPDPVETVVADLRRCSGVEAVVLGGSRASGRHRDTSDWDLGVYYRGALDLAPIAGHGEIHPLGTWGRLMNGGAWFEIDGTRIDVLLRDLDTVEHWMSEAMEGRFQIDGLPGYVAGIPTYSLVAELHTNVVLAGTAVQAPSFPDALRISGPATWRLNRDFSLKYAAMHAANGQSVAAAGQLSRATLEEAHARCCASGRWVLNEKHLIGDAGMSAVQAEISAVLSDPTPSAVASVAALLAALA